MTESKGSLWIALGDIHDDLSRLDGVAELKMARGILVTGDMTYLGGPAKTARILSELSSRTPRVLAQTGNMDLPEVSSWLSDKGCNLHARVTEIAPDTAVIGIEGSTPTPFHTPTEHTEAEYADWLSACMEEARRYANVILVSHNPPYGSACDRLPNGIHVGSKAVRDFLEKERPALCLCGHIHEAKAIDVVAGVPVINPGAFGDGGYVVVRLEDGTVRAELRQA